MDHDFLKVIESIVMVANKTPGYENKRIVYVFTGGGQRGIHTLAHASAMLSLNLFNGNHCLVAGSVGAIIAAFLRQGRIGIDKARLLFKEDATSSKVFNPWRFWRIFDTKKITDVMVEQRSGNEKFLGNSSLQRNEELWIWAMDKNCQTHFLKVKDADKPIEAIRASGTMPGIDGRMVEVNGHHLVDGAITNSLPLKEIVDAFDPTDVLILSNRPQHGPKSPKQSIWQKLYLLAITFLKHFSSPMVKRLLSQKDGWKEGMEFVASKPMNSQKEKINFAFLYPSDILVPKLLTNNEKNQKLLDRAFDETLEQTLATLEFSMAYIKQEQAREERIWKEKVSKAFEKAIAETDEQWLVRLNATIEEMIMDNEVEKDDPSNQTADVSPNETRKMTLEEILTVNEHLQTLRTVAYEQFGKPDYDVYRDYT